MGFCDKNHLAQCLHSNRVNRIKVAGFSPEQSGCSPDQTLSLFQAPPPSPPSKRWPLSHILCGTSCVCLTGWHVVPLSCECNSFQSCAGEEKKTLALKNLKAAVKNPKAAVKKLKAAIFLMT